MARESHATDDVDAIRGDIEAIKAQLASLMRHMGSAAADRTGQLCGDLREQGADAVRTQVRDLPITSVLIAFVAGTIVASILRSR